MLKPGVRENEIMGMMHKVAYHLGGEVFSGTLVTFGEFSWPNIRIFSANRIIRPGTLSLLIPTRLASVAIRHVSIEPSPVVRQLIGRKMTIPEH